MKNEVPIYMKLSDQCFQFVENQKKIDTEIFNKVRDLKLNFRGYSN